MEHKEWNFNDNDAIDLMLSIYDDLQSNSEETNKEVFQSLKQNLSKKAKKNHPN